MTAQSSMFSCIPAGYTDAGKGGTAVRGEKTSLDEEGDEESVCEGERTGFTECKDSLLTDVWLLNWSASPCSGPSLIAQSLNREANDDDDECEYTLLLVRLEDTDDLEPV
jgi:hypothetical protein